LVLAFNHAQTTTNANLDGLSSEERHKRDLYAECVAEANAEEQAAQAAATKKFEDETGITKLRQLDAAENERLEKLWCKPISELRRIYEHAHFRGIFDPYHRMPLTRANDANANTAEQFLETGKVFYSHRIQAGIEYSESDLDRIGFYISACGMAMAFGNREEVPDVVNIMCWLAAADRLEQLGAIKPKRTGTQPTPSMQITDTSDAVHDRKVVDADVLNAAMPLLDAWAQQLRRDYGYDLDAHPIARRKVLSWMEEKNLNPLDHSSYDKARRWATTSGVFPLLSNGEFMMTDDELLQNKIESGQIDLSTADGRRAYMYALNRIEAAKAGSGS
jgi:hypothetical protein